MRGFVVICMMVTMGCEAPAAKPLSSDTAKLHPLPAAQAAPEWYIDPQNGTGFASDTGTCTEITAPCVHFSELVARWGTNAPHLRQNTTIQFLSSQLDNTDPVAWRPYAENNTVPILSGALGTAQTIASGTLAAVTPKNRATGQLLQADFGVAVPTNVLVMNTTHPSCAWTYRAIAGTVMSLTQPVAPETPPASIRGAEVDTWAAGDSFLVFRPVSVNIVDLEPILSDEASSNNFLYVSDLAVMDPDGVGANALYMNNGVRVFDSIVSRGVTSVSPEPLPNGSSYGFRDSVTLSGVYMTTPSNWTFSGGALRGSSDQLYYPDLENDPIVEHTNAFYGFLNTTPFYIEGGAEIFVLPIYGIVLAPIWGPGKIALASEARVAYSGTATATFLQTGGLTLNGSATACAVVAGAWTCSIPLTPANLDAPPPAGFGGLAVEPGGASLVAGIGNL